jgi:hypothetical protein
MIDARELVEELQRAPDELTVRRIVATMRESLRSGTDIDRVRFDEIGQACSDHGVPLGVTWESRVLGVGETYLMLAGERTGDAIRIRAVTDAGARRRNTNAGLSNPDARLAIRSALRGLSSELGALGLGTPDDLDNVAFDTATAVDFNIIGSSLGLPVAVAGLARCVGSAPRVNVAGTAEVSADGRLRPVAGLPGKIEALAARWPQVDTVVVATEQADEARRAAVGRGTIVIVPASRLRDALPHFGLALDAALAPQLSVPDGDVMRRKVAAYQEAETKAVHSSQEWEALGAQARRFGDLLLQSGQSNRGVVALGWSAFFFSHAGLTSEAERILDEIDRDHRSIAVRLDSPRRGWLLLIEAAARVDGDPKRAAELARMALTTAESLERESREEVLGRARGTLGRALMHGGRYDEALLQLTAAAEFHREHQPEEEPRSRCYQATCLRLHGRPVEALSVAQAAERTTRDATLRRRAGSYLAGTFRFLRLEEGRCLLDLDRPHEALPAFEDALGHDWYPGAPPSYPEVAALRGIASCARRLHDRERTLTMLQECLRAAEVASGPLGSAAACAAADALVSGDDCGDQATLARAFERHFPKRLPSDTLLHMIY